MIQVHVHVYTFFTLYKTLHTTFNPCSVFPSNVFAEPGNFYFANSMSMDTGSNFGKAYYLSTFRECRFLVVWVLGNDGSWRC